MASFTQDAVTLYQESHVSSYSRSDMLEYHDLAVMHGLYLQEIGSSCVTLFQKRVLIQLIRLSAVYIYTKLGKLVALVI